MFLSSWHFCQAALELGKHAHHKKGGLPASLVVSFHIREPHAATVTRRAVPEPAATDARTSLRSTQDLDPNLCAPRHIRHPCHRTHALCSAKIRRCIALRIL